jgi:pyridoxamine 5'-phosphate oxidase
VTDFTPSPLRLLEEWIEDARARGLAQPASVAFATVGADGRPSARTVNLKRLEDDALLFTSALWTRKAREIEANPNVALLFHWPSLGRQAHLMGRAELAERELAEELFAERDLFHQLQSVVSRQGEPIDDLGPLRERLSHLAQVQETAPACPPDWGALRVRPEIVELWSEADDRIHERRLFARDGDGWALTLLSP